MHFQNWCGKLSISKAKLGKFLAAIFPTNLIAPMTSSVRTLVPFLAFFLAACASVTPPQPADVRDQYMATLKSLCGQRFEGAMTYAIDPKHAFASKLLVANFASCSDTEVRIPVQVGEDRSRTWVITRTASGLDLRHDHRHPDGTPDTETMYGGPADPAGSALSQSFFADPYTAKLIKGSDTNVWTISLSADKNTLTYHLERNAKPRVEAVFKRVSR